MHEITATIGLYVNMEKRTWSKASVREHIANLFPAVSIHWGEGVWKRQWEENVTISVGSADLAGKEDARKSLIDLGRTLKQDAIYIHGEGVVYMLIFPWEE